MNADKNALLKQILENLDQIGPISPELFLDIDLYMDQVTSFIEEQLKDTRRTEKDKILTKTMINNYTKNKLLPPPNKKKYTQKHMMILTMIYYMKGFLCLEDVKKLLTPLVEDYFSDDAPISIKEIYQQLYTSGFANVEKIHNSVLDTWQNASLSFENVPEEEKDFLQLFSFICSLCYDIYLKKTVIEKLLDSWPLS